MDYLEGIGFLLLWFVIFFIILFLPGMIFSSLVYLFLLRKLKRKKMMMFFLSVLCVIESPFNLYYAGYSVTHGWVNGSAEIFILVIFGSPVSVLINYLFLVMFDKYYMRKNSSNH